MLHSNCSSERSVSISVINAVFQEFIISPQNFWVAEMFFPSSVLLKKKKMRWLPTSILFAVPETWISFRWASQKWKTQPWNKEVLLEYTLFVPSNIFILDFGRLYVCHLVIINVLILVSVSSAGGLKCQFLLYMPGLHGRAFSSYMCLWAHS